MKPTVKMSRNDLNKPRYKLTATYPTYVIAGVGDTKEEAIADLLDSLEASLECEQDEKLHGTGDENP